ncbi:Probable prolyl 4-hydroxylase 11 [Striga hermonthica]|uniref:Probable prolyl 4-hydroxylase 11 n=1 Tax=Striga hermonthica TaxID=68872 RepID=A0A9N7RF40_STRHE|nr:Probable prolyl 4-hydroxylase 11 [Striga hermonthica]
MQEGTNLGQHVNIFNQVVTDLASLKVKIEGKDKAMILLCSLPPSYEHMVTTLTYGKETTKTEEITSALLAHHKRKQKFGESSSQSDSLYVKGNQDRGRRRVRDNSGNWNFRSKSRDKSKGRKIVTCYKCKEQGHFKRDCPKWKKQTADMSSMSTNVVQNEESDCSDGDMLSISTAQYDDAWILDSGCSYHITPNREWFVTYKPGNSGSVFLGDDRCCGIVGIGDVKIKIPLLLAARRSSLRGGYFLRGATTWFFTAWQQGNGGDSCTVLRRPVVNGRRRSFSWRLEGCGFHLLAHGAVRGVAAWFLGVSCCRLRTFDASRGRAMIGGGSTSD